MKRAWRALGTWSLASGALLGIVGGACGETVMQTTTTRFSYNDDGAPVAVTKQSGSAPAATTYLTWDNFQNGSVRAANGNLLGYGPNSDGSQLDTHFTYDARDRLIGVATAGQSVGYEYHAASLLASSTLGSSQDSRQFYYGNGSTPQVSNIHDSSSQRWSSVLGPVRYLSDGTEQVLVAPRKDTAGIFDATTQTLTAYQYDAYGERSDGAACAASNEYDLADNPFQYTGEYRDPTWCGTYLRARWYAPELRTFLQRDPADPVQRYGYVAGNPIMHADPTGLSWHSAYSSASRAFDKFAASPWGTAVSVLPFFGEATFIGQIAFNVSSYFHNARTAEMFGFNIAAGLLGSARDLGGGGMVDRAAGWKAGFGSRIVSDFAIGAGVSAFASTGGKHHRFETDAFLQNLGYTAAGIGAARGLAGVGYKPFALTAEDVDRHWTSLYQRANAHGYADLSNVLVYRVKEAPASGGRALSLLFNERPLFDALHNGPYHEAVVAVGHGEVWQTEINGFNLQSDFGTKRTLAAHAFGRDFAGMPSKTLGSPGAPKYELVGVYPRDKVATIFQNGEGRGIPRLAVQQRRFNQGYFSYTAYSLNWNNCHAYANDIVRQVQAIN